jgi:hypothetical protein
VLGVDGAIEALLASDPATLSHEARLDLLAELDRLAARVAARTQRVLAAVHTDPPPLRPGTAQKVRDKAFVREEVACLLRWSPAVAGTRLHDAADLVSRLPATLGELEAGRFSCWHAKALVDATRALDPAIAAKVERRVLPRAGEQTLANFRRSIDRTVLRLDPRRSEDRHRDARAARRVVCSPERDGMASLYAYLPAPDAARIRTRINTAADQMKRAGTGADERSADQRRADAFIDLLCGTSTGTGTGPTGRGRAEVQITVSLDTLCGRSDEPGELTGHGPLPAGVAAALARALCTDSTTRVRTVIVHGQQLMPPNGIDDTPQVYRPGTRLHDYVVARDRSCRFPGCHRQGHRCDIDHIVPFDGTNTIHANLHCLCPRHHHLKEEAGWHVTRAPDGTTRWTTPTGRSYDKPPDERPVDAGPDPPVLELQSDR